ncbi:DUF413 domain-containing protein [Falsiroseomonas oryziterrae]|uniref:DUF413 domain-containing protein n=1 Tax=Falsiroseomonas oryziterrae TaxID=2911368 RepID=UPI001F44F109|nr:DUF413 domain-containing protein [Roseomonas sp. NPKOSM-4]
MEDALTEREQALIERYGDFYRALNGGKRTPSTPEQVRFVAVCRGEADAVTEHEIAFTKYVRLERARRAAEYERRKAEAEARATMIEDAPGQRSYPSRMDGTLDDAAEWASKNGFRI